MKNALENKLRTIIYRRVFFKMEKVQTITLDSVDSVNSVDSVDSLDSLDSISIHKCLNPCAFFEAACFVLWATLVFCALFASFVYFVVMSW